MGNWTSLQLQGCDFIAIRDSGRSEVSLVLYVYRLFKKDGCWEDKMKDNFM